MKQLLLVLLAILGSLAACATWAQGPPYPPLSEYMMPRDAEMALARSAAPAAISDRATVKVLTASGYQVAHDGDNGFVCMVMRGWSDDPIPCLSGRWVAIAHDQRPPPSQHAVGEAHVRVRARNEGREFAGDRRALSPRSLRGPRGVAREPLPFSSSGGNQRVG
jgi:hypothetical protein